MGVTSLQCFMLLVCPNRLSVWKSGNREIQKSGNREIQDFLNLEIQKVGIRQKTTKTYQTSNIRSAKNVGKVWIPDPFSCHLRSFSPWTGKKRGPCCYPPLVGK